MRVIIYDDSIKDHDKSKVFELTTNSPIDISTGDKELWLGFNACQGHPWLVELQPQGLVEDLRTEQFEDKEPHLPTAEPPTQRFPYCDKKPRRYIHMPQACEGCKDTAPCRVENKRLIRAIAVTTKASKK